MTRCDIMITYNSENSWGHRYLMNDHSISKHFKREISWPEDWLIEVEKKCTLCHKDVYCCIKKIVLEMKIICHDLWFGLALWALDSEIQLLVTPYLGYNL